MLRRLLLSLALLLGCAPAVAASAPSADVQTTWQLLDYLAVDYGGAVRGGKVVSASEYAEMREFSTSAVDKIAGLPANSAKPQLVAEGKRFAAMIGGDWKTVQGLAHDQLLYTHSSAITDTKAALSGGPPRLTTAATSLKY